MYRILIPVLLVIAQPAAGVSLLIDDDFSAYSATGLSPGGAGGMLDSNRWVVTGASNGDTTFGATHTAGDFARGTSAGGVGTGGLYSFLLPGGQTGIGVQATGSDFTPGSLIRRVVNTAGNAMTDLTVALDLWYLNNGARSTRMSAEFSTPEAPDWTPLPGVVLDTPTTADSLGWQAWPVLAMLPLPLLEAEGTLFLRWHVDDAAGAGSRDEIALSLLRLSGTSAATVALPNPLPAPPALALALLAACVPAARRARGGRWGFRGPPELTSTPRPPSTP